LIVVNFAAFVYEIILGEGLGRFVWTYGIIPARFFSQGFLGSEDAILRFVPVFTSMFLHSGWFHILGNMLYLWVFGDNVEDYLGHLQFLAFYVVCGLGAGLFQIYAAPHSIVPMVGASGAIAGILGAYLMLFPRAKVIALVPVFFFLQVMEVPALIFLGFWFLIQFLSGVASLSSAAYSSSGGIAWWAHIGGFVSGIVLVSFLRKR
jgi:membrane associated rhomboid family serine protease